MEKEVAVAATMSEKRMPTLPGPTCPNLGFWGAHGERKGKERGRHRGIVMDDHEHDPPTTSTVVTTAWTAPATSGGDAGPKRPLGLTALCVEPPRSVRRSGLRRGSPELAPIDLSIFRVGPGLDRIEKTSVILG
jgi:hypothetical protein